MHTSAGGVHAMAAHFSSMRTTMQVVDKWRYAGEESSEREIRILSQVQHENCIQMHAVFVTGRRVYIVTDLVSGGELLDKCALVHTYRIHNALQIDNATGRS